MEQPDSESRHQQRQQQQQQHLDYRPRCFLCIKCVLMTLYIVSIIVSLSAILLLVFSSVTLDYLLAQTGGNAPADDPDEARDILLRLKTLKSSTTLIVVLFVMLAAVTALQTWILFCIHRESFTCAVIMFVLAALACFITIPGVFMDMYGWAAVAVQALFTLLWWFYVSDLRRISKRKRDAEAFDLAKL